MQEGSALTDRQRDVLAFVLETFRATGMPPKLHAVQKRFRFSTARGAQIHLKALVRKGFLTHRTNEHPAYWPREVEPGGCVPIVGTAPAGNPADQPEDHRGQLRLPWPCGENAFAVRVTGLSMRDANVLDGDFVVVDPDREPGDGAIVLAQLRGESTIKRLKKTKGSFELLAANPDFATQVPDEERDRIVGPIVAVIRKTA